MKNSYVVVLILLSTLISGCSAGGAGDSRDDSSDVSEENATVIDVNITTIAPGSVYTWAFQVWYNITYDNGFIETKSKLFSNSGIFGDEEILIVSEEGESDTIKVTFQNYRLVRGWERETIGTLSGGIDVITFLSNGTATANIDGIQSSGTWTSTYYTDTDPAFGDQSGTIWYVSSTGYLFMYSSSSAPFRMK